MRVQKDVEVARKVPRRGTAAANMRFSCLRYTPIRTLSGISGRRRCDEGASHLLDRGLIGVEGVLGAVHGDGPEDAIKAKVKRREPGTASDAAITSINREENRRQIKHGHYGARVHTARVGRHSAGIHGGQFLSEPCEGTQQDM